MGSTLTFQILGELHLKAWLSKCYFENKSIHISQHSVCSIQYAAQLINLVDSHFTNGLVEVNIESDATLLKNRKVRPSAEFIRNIAENGIPSPEPDSIKQNLRELSNSLFRKVFIKYTRTFQYIVNIICYCKP